MDTHKKEHTVAVGDGETGEMAVLTVRNRVKDITRMVLICAWDILILLA
jgi:hypothetical protein